MTDTEAKIDIEQQTKNTVNTTGLTDYNKKVRKTIYWCVEFSDNELNKILKNESIAQQLKNNPQLITLNKMHTTLLYLGKKDNNSEKDYFDVIGKECNLEVDCYAVSENSLCLNVSCLQFNDNKLNVPTFAKRQHVTVALKQNVRAADSTLAFEQGDTINFDTKLVLKGFIKRY